MKTSAPEVSVILPVYNSEKFVAEAIKSVQNQTFTAWELIIVDDGSSDRTQHVIQKFLKDGRIKYIYQKNKGIAGARNTGINVAKGKYVALIDGDDVWDPLKIQLQIDVLKKEKANLVYSSLRRIDENGTYLGRTIGTGAGFYDGLSTLFRLISGNISIPNSSVVVEKKWMNRIGNYDEHNEKVQQLEDYDLLFRLLAAGATFYGIDAVLGSYRRHAGQVTHKDSAQNLVMIEYITHHLMAKYPGKESFLKFLILLRLSFFYQGCVDKQEAKRECLKIYHANEHIDSYWFDKYLIDAVSLPKYLRFRRLLIRRFRKFKTYTALFEEG